MSSLLEESISTARGSSCARSSAATVCPFWEGSTETGFVLGGLDRVVVQGLNVGAHTTITFPLWVTTETTSAAVFPATDATASSAPAAYSTAAVESLTCSATNCPASWAARSCSAHLVWVLSYSTWSGKGSLMVSMIRPILEEVLGAVGLGITTISSSFFIILMKCFWEVVMSAKT